MATLDIFFNIRPAPRRSIQETRTISAARQLPAAVMDPSYDNLSRMRNWAVVLLALGMTLELGCFGGFNSNSPANNAPRAKPDVARAGAKSPKKKEEQSYAQAWALICHAERRSGASPTMDRTERGTAVAAWIVKRLKNKKARYWFIGFGKVKKSRRQAFQREAGKGGQPSCPLSTLLFGAASQPASRPSR